MAAGKKRKNVFTPNPLVVKFGKSKTYKSHTAECDINNIIARFDDTGQLPRGRGPGQFIDITGLQGDPTDLINRSQETLEKLDQANAELLAKRKKDADALAQEEKQIDLEDAIAVIKKHEASQAKSTDASASES